MTRPYTYVNRNQGKSKPRVSDADRVRNHHGRKGTLRETDFQTIHRLAKSGIKRGLIAEATGWGKSTVARVLMWDTFVEYRRYLQELYERQTPTNGIVTHNTLGSAVEEIKAEAKAETDTKEVPTDVRIAVALERLADAWEQKPTRRGLLFNKK